MADNPICAAIAEFMRDIEKSWTGTPAELYTSLAPVASRLAIKVDNPQYWPTNAQKLSQKLNTLTHNLSVAGILVNSATTGRGKDKKRVITIKHAPRAAGTQVAA